MKNHECSFCGDRFKNRREAELHQDSVHARRHSWSCSNLPRKKEAFYESSTRPGEADICGYCGQNFERSGTNPDAQEKTRHTTSRDWTERLQHLGDHHRFRECDLSVRFDRADRFRQHLRHSHAAENGRWMHTLESACVREQDEPRSIKQPTLFQSKAADAVYTHMPPSPLSETPEPCSTTMNPGRSPCDRRASSPSPGTGPASCSASLRDELLGRRGPVARGSPTPRLFAHPTGHGNSSTHLRHRYVLVSHPTAAP